MKNNRVKDSFLSVMKNRKGICSMILLTVVGVVTCSLIPPQILKLIIDRNLVPKKSEKLLTYAVIYLLIIFLIGIFDFTKEALLTVLGQKFTKDIRLSMVKKLGRMNVLFFTNQASGTIVSRIMNDVDAVNSLFTNGIISMMIDCFKIIGILASVWIFSSRLGIITALLIPFIYGITRLFKRRMLKAQIDNRIMVGKINNHLSESLKNIVMIKSFSKENYMEDRYADLLTENYKTVEKVNFYDSIFPPIIQLIRAVIIGIIVLCSSKYLNLFGISLGMVAASIDLISNLFVPIESLGMELQSIQQAVSGIHRINDFYNEEEDGDKIDTLKAENIIRNRENVTLILDHVVFHYDEKNEILEDINLVITSSEKVTFIGRTGVGKSTLFKLILGLLKPVNGSITINGVDVYSIPNSEKRKIFGYVDQSFPLIKGTVADQISLRDNSISMDQINAAINFVGMTDYVTSMEHGLNTPVTKSTQFSQGQRQLLAIARAIVMNPPILLFDEITAGLDSITEEKIVNVLRKAEAKHTILSVSHRLSSMVASDMIVILENGRVKSKGTPELLLQGDEWYRKHIALEKLTWN